MRKSTLRKLQTSARRGARFLDKNLPGWDRKVKLTKLRMEVGAVTLKGCGCVLAQTHRDYGSGLSALDLDVHEADHLGFTLLDDCFAEPGGCHEYWAPLTDFWKDEIRKRRAAA